MYIGATSDHSKQVMANDIQGDLGPSETKVSPQTGYQNTSLEAEQIP